MHGGAAGEGQSGAASATTPLGGIARATRQHVHRPAPHQIIPQQYIHQGHSFQAVQRTSYETLAVDPCSELAKYG